MSTVVDMKAYRSRSPQQESPTELDDRANVIELDSARIRRQWAMMRHPAGSARREG